MRAGRCRNEEQLDGEESGLAELQLEGDEPAARWIIRGSRRLRLCLAARWPWTRDVTAAISRLQSMAPG